jgi:CRP-like cAMP-binding protein
MTMTDRPAPLNQGRSRRGGDGSHESLFARGRIKHYAAKDVIFSVGQAADRMVALLSGAIRISLASQDGRDIVLAILGPGDVCGEIALLDGGERTTDARAATDCTVVMLERHEVLAHLAQHPGAWPTMVEMLCRRLRSVDRQIGEFALAPVPVRLAKALLQLTISPQAADARTHQCVRLNQIELADLIGATRECVNKYLRSWQRQGCLTIADRQVVIADRAAIEHLAQNRPAPAS